MTDVQILSHLKTEASDARSANLSELAPLEFARLMNDFNREAVSAVESALPQIARAIEGIAARLKAGGRLFYLGAGTSGRLGVLDASECPPTFGVDADLVVGIMAGGDGALRNAAEGAEDDGPAAVRDLQARDLRAADAVVAISASGYAPYCRAALDYAREVARWPLRSVATKTRPSPRTRTSPSKRPRRGDSLRLHAAEGGHRHKTDLEHALHGRDGANGPRFTKT